MVISPLSLDSLLNNNNEIPSPRSLVPHTSIVDDCLTDTSLGEQCPETSLYTKLFQKSHHRSIFQLRQDEHRFITLFSDIISRIAQRKLVKRCEILERAHNSKGLVQIMEQLRFNFPNDDIDKKIFNKVRTLGYKARKD